MSLTARDNLAVFLFYLHFWNRESNGGLSKFFLLYAIIMDNHELDRRSLFGRAQKNTRFEF